MKKLFLRFFGIRLYETKKVSKYDVIPGGIETGHLYISGSMIVLCTGKSLTNPKYSFAGVCIWDSLNGPGNVSGFYTEQWNIKSFKAYTGKILMV